MGRPALAKISAPSPATLCRRSPGRRLSLPLAADSRCSRPRSAQACSPSLRWHSAADQAQHVAVRAVAVLRRGGDAARVRHRAADGHRHHRLRPPPRPYGRAGAPRLAAVTVGLSATSRFLVSYPVGRITDHYGRKPGILFGQGLAMIGTFCTGLAMLAGSAIGLTLGMVIFASGIGAAMQLRFAATDMYPPRQRGLALGFIATGSLVGILLSPLVMVLADWVAQRTGHDAIALPWLSLAGVILAGQRLG